MQIWYKNKIYPILACVLRVRDTNAFFFLVKLITFQREKSVQPWHHTKWKIFSPPLPSISASTLYFDGRFAQTSIGTLFEMDFRQQLQTGKVFLSHPAWFRRVSLHFYVIRYISALILTIIKFTCILFQSNTNIK